MNGKQGFGGATPMMLFLLKDTPLLAAGFFITKWDIASRGNRMPKIHVGDINLYYEIIGQGEPVLFIHGLGSSTRDWELQVEPFSKAYQVIVYDVRGHGVSDKPSGPYSIPLFAKDAIELIKSLEIAPVHIVGISMGGMIGFQLAVDAPELIKSLVVVNCGPERIVKTIKHRIQFFQRQFIVRILGMRKMGKVLSKRLFPKEGQEEIRNIFVERWAENDPRAYRESLKAIVGWSVMDRLEVIGCPVLVIAAVEDYTPVETKVRYVKEIPHGELVVIEDSRHATPADQPEAFNQVLMDFLRVQG
jgi:pimeloyl-ACP methyl ester carboxylesterase